MKTRKYRINDMEYDVCVNSLDGNHADVTVNGVSYQVEILPENQELAPSQPQVATLEDSRPASSHVDSFLPSEGGRTVSSPLPGVIVSVHVRVGESVRAGQVVAVLEAMKMENEIQSEYDGVVTSVNVSQGDSVLEGAAIVTIA